MNGDDSAIDDSVSRMTSHDKTSSIPRERDQLSGPLVNHFTFKDNDEGVASTAAPPRSLHWGEEVRFGFGSSYRKEGIGRPSKTCKMAHLMSCLCYSTKDRWTLGLSCDMTETEMDLCDSLEEEPHFGD